MSWWGWITVGALLLLAELMLVDVEFYLVFLGLSALLTGLLVLGGLSIPYWAQWLLFAFVSVGSLVLFRRALHQRLRPPPGEEIREGADGERATAEATIEAGGMGPVSLRGTTWSAHNISASAIASGQACRVTEAKGLTLKVRPEPS